MLKVVLLAPEIPQNTGNIGRLCVNTESELHLIEPLGFSLDETSVRRAGLDYWPHLKLAVHKHWAAFLEDQKPTRLVFASTKGRKSVFETHFCASDCLIFGNETSGFPEEFYRRYSDDLYQIPMPGEHARSLNLANSVAVVLYEALRQTLGWGTPRG
ncbi:MAG: tRNA (cytidine(34)-2'-O)-methyltransferase [Candidatus Pacebacteria bacterium]|nr:tRNA (cytidine(34)-2'-O)-methyltransferase [Candidatus Paceibacterota bacterium]